MFGGFSAAVEKREQEQAAISAAVTSPATAPAAPESKPTARKSTIMLTISDEDKLKVKKYALEHGTSVSKLVSEWIAVHCSE